MKKPLSVVCALVLACIASSALAEEAHDDEHPELSGALHSFHDVMRADWHGTPGPERNRAACENVGRYITIGWDIVEQDKPEHAAAADWTAATHGLLDASVALGAYCSSALDANVVSGLSTVHDRFHDVMKLMQQPEQY